jgi:hypothetical protein
MAKIPAAREPDAGTEMDLDPIVDAIDAALREGPVLGSHRTIVPGVTLGWSEVIGDSSYPIHLIVAAPAPAVDALVGLYLQAPGYTPEVVWAKHYPGNDYMEIRPPKR